MRKRFLVYITIVTTAACLLAACGKTADPAAGLTDTAIDNVTGKPAEEAAEQEGINTDIPDEEQVPQPDSEDVSVSTDSDKEDVQQEQKKDIPDIVWLGDSLTQGSLGEDNHDQNNPHAPWRVLGEISGLNVAGAGFYGFTAHDIFWAYKEYGGIIDPSITYIYWVGSNDFFRSPDNIGSVIEEIDNFNKNAGITDFLVLGTTDRHDMDPNAYISINKTFEETYGDKYLDIMPYVEYGPDGVHLTEESYAAVARAVYDKLK